MRLGLVLHRVPKYSETFFHSLISIWKSLGHEVVIFGGWEEKLPTEDYYPALPNFPRTISAWRYLIEVLSKAKSWRLGYQIYSLERGEGVPWIRAIKRAYFNLHFALADIQWLHFGYLSACLQREAVGLALGVPVSASVRGADIGILPFWVEEPYRRMWPKLSKLHVLSEDLLTLCRQYGLPSELAVHKIYPVYNQPLPTSRVPRGMKDGPLRIVWVGRMTWKKNPELALQVIHSLKGAGVSVQLTMVGEGEMTQEVKRSAEVLGLDVQFEGVISHTVLISKLSHFDILLHTAWQEGFGNVLIEAQAAGLWVVSTPAEGISENIVPGRSGFLSPDWSTENLVAGIIQYYQVDRSFQQEHAVFSRARVQSLFSSDLHVANWRKFFASV